MSFGQQVKVFLTLGVGIIGGQLLVRMIFGGGRRQEQYPRQQQNNDYNVNDTNNYAQPQQSNDMYSSISKGISSGGDRRH
jgi:hypothetical protein